MGQDQLKRLIQREAADLGFSAVGFARARRIAEGNLDTWLKRQYQGEMGYLERNREKRLDPGLVLKNIKTIVCVRMDYSVPHAFSDSDRSRTSKTKVVRTAILSFQEFWIIGSSSIPCMV